MIAVVILQRVLAKMSCDGKKLSNVRSFIMLRSRAGLPPSIIIIIGLTFLVKKVQ